jgi:uncharacterized protein (DUF2147 family)
VAPCGAALCGIVTKVLSNKSMSRDGKEMTPEQAQRTVGLKILIDLQPVDATPTAPATEWKGQIYNRENEKTYSAKLSVSTAGNPAGELMVRGYVGLPLFGQTQRWVRAPSAAI